MATGLLFVTAPNADFKVINPFLIYARDWEFGEEDTWDNFHLVTSRNASYFNQFKDSPRNDLATTKPGDVTVENFSNQWAGTSVRDIEQHILSIDDSESDGIDISVFLVIDEQSLQDRTCIMAERYTWNDDVDPWEQRLKGAQKKHYDFNKYRAPWDETYIVFVNLSLGNLRFDEYANEDEGTDEEG
ncbi:hypothetical protein M409DRAFT_54987 [Zasmidium cellare ATCC 36951]|uniref:DUF6924 domain-containing protein n=1 Tax=Zasmidium cellare ATCC 36951 TaxID=1080233 RepID=A0A6A6CHQ1_ZASCE|nr:uncharacterized protein M409DRAFT_54987 [Zasmidium cellare ATCC 36951]KAF2166665.1 hypothetical protein M409DRAFT_54987 [Zasmidium cellare ATCC 36951]